MPSSSTMHDLISVLESRRELAPLEVAFAASFLLDEAASLVLKADFLRALALKGETDVEIGAFVEAFLDRAIDPEIDPASLPGPAIDVCGTGGDRLDLFNVSTTSMFVLAAGGAAVVKHGNRSITSQSGVSDFFWPSLFVGDNLGLFWCQYKARRVRDLRPKRR